MNEKIVMPKMGETLVEGTIVQWLKNEGEYIEKNENILLISTDKVEAEIPAPMSGTLKNIQHQAGDIVPVGQTLAYISTSEEKSHSVTEAIIPNTQKEDTLSENPKKVTVDVSPDIKDVRKEKNVPGDLFLSPIIKKIVKKYDISKEDLLSIDGSGKNGRLTKNDIISLVQSKNSINFKKNNVNNQSQQRSTQQNSNSNAALPRILQNDSSVLELSPLRKVIMSNMVNSKAVSAHVSTFFKVNYEKIENARKNYKKNSENITYTSFVISAVSQVIKRHPYISSELQKGKIVLRKNVNIGFAVAVKNPEPGLLVPVIKNADQLSISGISQQIKHLSDLTRSKKISIDNLSGGTFTVTNPGNYGAIIGTPIINQPQVAILSVGSISKEPIVVENGQIDSIAICKMGWLCLTFDHRIIDGVVADAFMQDVKNTLDNWQV